MPQRWTLTALKHALAQNPPRRLHRPRRAAVLIPIIDDGGDQRLILTRRSDTVGTHKGHVSFPGGFIEDDDRDSLHTALRESEEEIGLDPDAVQVLGGLDDFPTILPDVIVTPWAGRLTEAPTLNPNPREVARVFEVPLKLMSDPCGWRQETMLRNGAQWPIYYFDYDGEVIWGLTGYIILKLLVHSPWGSPFEIATERFR